MNRDAGQGDDALPQIQRLNRLVLVVTPREPYVTWVNTLGLDDEGEGPLTLDEAEIHHQSTFLVPFEWEAELIVDWVGDNVDVLFEQMLHSVIEDPSRWPTARDVDAFEAWFSLDLLDSPIDLVEAPLYAVEGDEAADGTGDEA